MTNNRIPGHQVVADASCLSGTQAAMTVTSTPQPARCGTTNAHRKVLTVFNNSEFSTIYWGWSSEVTTASGTPIEPKTLMIFNVSSDIDVYLVSSGNINTRITEAI